MLSFTTEIFVTHLIRADDMEHRHTTLDLVPAHYSISYELSGCPDAYLVDAIKAAVFFEVNHHVILPGGVGVYPGFSFSSERVLVGDGSLPSMALEMANLALSICVGTETSVESVKVVDLESGLSFALYLDD